MHDSQNQSWVSYVYIRKINFKVNGIVREKEDQLHGNKISNSLEELLIHQLLNFMNLKTKLQKYMKKIYEEKIEWKK